VRGLLHAPEPQQMADEINEPPPGARMSLRSTKYNDRYSKRRFDPLIAKRSSPYFVHYFNTYLGATDTSATGNACHIIASD
jgi:hypothetical protein